VLPRGGLFGIKRFDIKTIQGTLDEKNINLAPVKSRLKFPNLVRDTSQGQNISSPPPCREENGRCMASRASP
jgi:hypothetical protein